MEELLFYNEWEPWGELCNYFVRDMVIDGITWKSVEHYYQAEKSLDPVYRQLVHDAVTPADAKALGNDPAWEHRADWDTWKLMAMRRGIFYKFIQNRDLRELLLSTGDKAFRAKCEARMQELLQDNGTTLLYVSHVPNAIRKICNKGLWLDSGSIVMQGDADEVCTAYESRT